VKQNLFITYGKTDQIFSDLLDHYAPQLVLLSFISNLSKVFQTYSQNHNNKHAESYSIYLILKRLQT
jgi:hypothetical protein